MTLELPSAPDLYDTGLALSAQDRLDAVTDGLRYATLPLISRIEEQLHAALERSRRRERAVDWIRDALALCHARRIELAAEGGMASGAHSPHQHESKQHV